MKNIICIENIAVLEYEAPFFQDLFTQLINKSPLVTLRTPLTLVCGVPFFHTLMRLIIQ